MGVVAVGWEDKASFMARFLIDDMAKIRSYMRFHYRKLFLDAYQPLDDVELAACCRDLSGWLCSLPMLLTSPNSHSSFPPYIQRCLGVDDSKQRFGSDLHIGAFQLLSARACIQIIQGSEHITTLAHCLAPKKCCYYNRVVI